MLACDGVVYNADGTFVVGFFVCVHNMGVCNAMVLCLFLSVHGFIEDEALVLLHVTGKMVNEQFEHVVFFSFRFFFFLAKIMANIGISYCNTLIILIER